MRVIEFIDYSDTALLINDVEVIQVNARARSSWPIPILHPFVRHGVADVVVEELGGLLRPRLCTAYGSTFFHATLMRTRSCRL